MTAGGILRFMLLYAPNWLFLLPGAMLMVVGLALVFWLLPGPRHLTDRIEIDIHTMVFGVIFTLMGAQIIAVGFFAKVFSYAERFDRNPISLKRMLRRVQLEHGLAFGGVLFLAGFAGCVWITWRGRRAASALCMKECEQSCSGPCGCSLACR